MTAVQCLHCATKMHDADDGALRRQIEVHYEVACRRGVALAAVRP